MPFCVRPSHVKWIHSESPSASPSMPFSSCVPASVSAATTLPSACKVSRRATTPATRAPPSAPPTIAPRDTPSAGTAGCACRITSGAMGWRSAQVRCCIGLSLAGRMGVNQCVNESIVVICCTKDGCDSLHERMSFTTWTNVIQILNLRAEAFTWPSSLQEVHSERGGVLALLWPQEAFECQAHWLRL